MNAMATRTMVVLTLTLTLCVSVAPGVGEERQTFEAFAVSMGTSNPPVIPTGSRATIQLNISRWSTDEERGQLLGTLVEKGAEAMVELLKKQDETGWVRVTSPARSNVARRAMGGPPPPPRYVLQYAREFPREGGGRRIVLGLDRPIAFYEAMYGTRSRDYDVTLIIMDVDAEGKGEGQLAMGVKLAVDKENQKLVIENFGSEPVRLTSIRQR